LFHILIFKIGGAAAVPSTESVVLTGVIAI